MQGRKVVDNNHNIIALLKDSNTIALSAYGIFMIIIALIIFAIFRLVTRKKRKERRIARKNAKQMAKIE